MIIAKTDTGSYLTDFGAKIGSKEFYEKELLELNGQIEPTDKELITFAKEMHPYYRRDLVRTGIENQIQEINDYEQREDKVVLADPFVREQK